MDNQETRGANPGQKFGSRFLLHVRPLANSALMRTLTIHCLWEDEMVRERTAHPPSYAEAKKMKSLTLHTHGCPRASLRDCSSCSSNLTIMAFIINVSLLDLNFKPTYLSSHSIAYRSSSSGCGTWWRIGWVDSFELEGRGFDSCSSHHVGTLGKSLTHSCLWRFGVKLWHSIRAVLRALLSRNGLEEAL